MKDSKRNKEFQNAVSSGAKKAASGVSSGLRRFVRSLRVWQKAGLALCLVFWILSAAIGAYCTRVTGRMADQNFARRWSPDGSSVQVSAFLSDAAGASEDTVSALYSTFYNTLQSDAIALSDTQIENGASLIDVCYCGIGSAEVSCGDESVSVTAIGVGGDFFNFHPLDLMDGYYFSEDDSMQDRILLDDETAWRLFGSPHVVGMQVEIGGTPHFVAGVFRRPTGRFYKSSGMGSYLLYMSYDSLCRYTQSAPSAGGDFEEDDSYMYDARLQDGADPGVFVTTAQTAQDGKGAEDPAAAARTLPDREEPEIPETAAWAPVLHPAGLTALEEDFDDGEADAGEDLTEEAEEEEEDDSPDDSGPGRTPGMGGYYSDDDDGSSQREEVNRSRMNCYEVVLPNPVSGYALSMVTSGMNQAGISPDQMTVVENTSRFAPLRLILMLAQPGVRSMQTAAIRYPYWENVALAWEDVLIPYRFFQMFLRYSPVLFLLFLVLWYATHKSWTVGGLLTAAQDRLYDRQSEKIYGKRPAEGAIEDGQGAQKDAEALPDGAGCGRAESERPKEAEGTPSPEQDAPGDPGLEEPEKPKELEGPAGPEQDAPGDPGPEEPEKPKELEGPAGPEQDAPADHGNVDTTEGS